jgi:hypothetical protein
MKTRIKQGYRGYFPQYRSWFMWHPIIVSIRYSLVEGSDPGWDITLKKSHWWVNEINAQRAIDKFISNGYRNDD